MTENWARSQERKRNLLSTAIIGSIYVIALLAFWLLGMLSIKDLSDFSGPIQVKLGSPEGQAESAFLSGQQEEPPPVEEAPEEELESQTTEKEDDQTISDNTIAEASPSPATPKPTPKISPTVKPTATPKRSAKPSPSPRASTSPRTSATPAPSPSAQLAKVSLKPEVMPDASPGSGTSPNAKAGAAIIKGSEQGNSYETNFEEGASVVGRGLYVPIYLYLPLPYYVDNAIFNSIKASADGFTSAENRRAEFKKHYKVGEGAWVLRDTVPYDERPRLWILLNECGYEISKADYKNKALRSVVLQFQVGAQKGNSIPSLESVKLLSSSGYSDIDDSVIYGFKKAAFYNNSPKSVTGRFTYSFD